MGLSKSVCAQYEGYLRVYRKSAFGGSFVPVGGGLTNGQWVEEASFFGPRCAPLKAASYVGLRVFGPPAFTSVVRRVTVGAKVSTARWLCAPVRRACRSSPEAAYDPLPIHSSPPS